MGLDQWIVTGHRARSLAEAHPQPQSDNHLEVLSSALAVQLYKTQRHGVNSEAFVSVFVETLFVDDFCCNTAIHHTEEKDIRE